ncbi:hypothetical protein [Selenihalanaerobacter shriftii]|uniref:Uncharacterized protein n=1 Tax=Selenihalanaerobacter shriftii TaxID=142842 RepID=A0A1T4LS94_9FIRM|nr:hypothetical protein [Selenihalanaerobacter shriftii]SJZ57573.1 hypothetical protein SAMN02745118_01230 [Selenihalanaerobacter shriftii]
MDNDLFEDQLLLKNHRKKIKEYLEGNIDEEKLLIKKEILNHIPDEIVKNLEFFVKLDSEFKKYGEKPQLNDPEFKMFSINHIKDKSWRGVWLKATGRDSTLYLNWLFAGIKREKYKEKSLNYWYRQVHPSEKYIPHSVIVAEKMFKKYYK